MNFREYSEIESEELQISEFYVDYVKQNSG